MDHTAEAIAPADVAGPGVIERGDGTRRFGRALFEGAVRTMFVVVADVDVQHPFELMAREDQHAVEAFLVANSSGFLFAGWVRCRRRSRFSPAIANRRYIVRMLHT